MRYRVCKVYEVESGHLLSKHPGRCRLPHGHSRRIEVVLSAETLDEHDMVVDFKALRLALDAELDKYDHAMAVNSQDPHLEGLLAMGKEGGGGGRVVVFENEDPTTEAMARRIYEHLSTELAAARVYTDEQGVSYRLRPDARLERVRVGETSTSWAEYGE